MGDDENAGVAIRVLHACLELRAAIFREAVRADLIGRGEAAITDRCAGAAGTAVDWAIAVNAVGFRLETRVTGAVLCDAAHR